MTRTEKEKRINIEIHNKWRTKNNNNLNGSGKSQRQVGTRSTALDNDDNPRETGRVNYSQGVTIHPVRDASPFIDSKRAADALAHDDVMFARASHPLPASTMGWSSQSVSHCQTQSQAIMVDAEEKEEQQMEEVEVWTLETIVGAGRHIQFLIIWIDCWRGRLATTKVNHHHKYG